MADKKKSDAAATLHLTIHYNQIKLVDILEAAREVVEKATEMGKCEGFMEISRAERIDVNELT